MPKYDNPTAFVADIPDLIAEAQYGADWLDTMMSPKVQEATNALNELFNTLELNQGEGTLAMVLQLAVLSRYAEKGGIDHGTMFLAITILLHKYYHATADTKLPDHPFETMKPEGTA